MNPGETDKKLSVRCKLCNKAFANWSEERIKLHKESCSEKKARKLVSCPACLEVLTKGTYLKHLRLCAGYLGASLYDLILLDDNHIYKPKNNGIQPLKKQKDPLIPKSQTKKPTKKPPKSTAPSIEHLLISTEARRKIFFDRLSLILERNHAFWSLPEARASKSNVSSDLWKLSLLHPDLVSASKSTTHFYLQSLSKLVTPVRKSRSINRLRLSQIPGRGPSTQPIVVFKGTNVSLQLEVKQVVVETKSHSNLTMLSHMVNNPICADLTIQLDSGETVPAHRFILAAWNPDLPLLKESNSSIAAPGISKEDLLKLLHSLYAFDLTSLTTFTPEAEFTLDCWQMLDAVRAKVQSQIAALQGDAKTLNELQNHTAVEPCGGHSNTSVASRTSVDLFASLSDNSVFACTPHDSSKRCEESASHSTPFPISSLGGFSLKPVNSIEGTQSSSNVPVELETGVLNKTSPESNQEPASRGENGISDYVIQEQESASHTTPFTNSTVWGSSLKPANSLEMETDVSRTPTESKQEPVSAFNKALDPVSRDENGISTYGSRDQLVPSSPNKPGLSYEKPCVSPGSPVEAKVDSDEVCAFVSPQATVSSQNPRSPTGSLGFDNDPPAFCESFHNNSFEMHFPSPPAIVNEVPETNPSTPAKALSFVEEHRTAETTTNPQASRTPQASAAVKRPNCFPEKDAVIDLTTLNDSFLFEDSAPTPAPLAKRLCASVESQEDAEVIARLPSEPVAMEIASDQEEAAPAGGSSAEDNAEISFSQPASTTLKANGRRRRITSVIRRNVPITPKPAFEAMRTPELRKALSDYGVRHLPKKKAIQLLNHIYDELHPYVDAPSVVVEDNGVPETSGTKAPAAGDSFEGFAVEEPSNQRSPLELIKSASLPSQTTSSARSSSSKSTGKDQDKDEVLKARVMECLRNDENVYFNIITYVPLELDCVKALLRDAGVKIGMKRLTEMLDSWGVTFTTRSRNAPKPHADDPESLW